jgi:predicted DCC family thiol-disulfide oxidoreductase YuxK
MDRPLLLFDRDCGFCRKWVARWQWKLGSAIDAAPYQEAAQRFDVDPDACARAVHLVEPDGRVTRGAEAVFRAASYGRGPAVGLWAYRQLPGFARLAEIGYAFVAAHRGPAMVVTRLLWGDDPRPSTYVLARGAFLRLLGVVFLIALLSLRSQIDGLVGSSGILPVAPLLEATHARVGGEAYWRMPTLCWLNASDGFLHAQCLAGIVLALLLVAGAAPRLVLALLWVVYLSLSVAGQTFLGFQWDTLLLETCFVAWFVAPRGWWLSLRSPPPTTAGMTLVRLLLFKLMFLSGVTKLLSGDPTWLDGSAMTFHYETQPIPAWTSWWAHQLPAWFQSLSTAGMFVVEVLVPFLIVAPRRVRHLAALALVVFQVMIAATGNYGFFNLLTIVLCVPLLDDRLIRRALPRGRRAAVDEVTMRRPAPRRRAWIGRTAAGLVATASALALVDEMVRTQQRDAVPAWVVGTLDAADAALLSWGRPLLLDWSAPFRTINGYGLFRVMTTERPEIEVEGSFDGRTWARYEFRWKAGDPRRGPRFVAPHMPRLDWQMWFAALNPRGAGWLNGFVEGLLYGRPEVTGLLERNPFQEDPPRKIRLVYYRYRFTSVAQRRETGEWWTRERVGTIAVVDRKGTGRP